MNKDPSVAAVSAPEPVQAGEARKAAPPDPAETAAGDTAEQAGPDESGADRPGPKRSAEDKQLDADERRTARQNLAKENRQVERRNPAAWEDDGPEPALAAQDEAPKKPRKQPPGPGARQGQKQGGKPRRPPVPQVVEVQPLAKPAGMQRRHRGLILSFLLMVLIPVGALIYYLWFVSVDQYGSTTGFTIRQEESGGATDLLGGLAQFAGTSTSTDSDILYEFIRSQEIVEVINNQLDLRAHYSAHWPKDWVFSIWPDATLEDLIWYWQRIVRISYDQSTGLIEVRVLAFDADYAKAVAAAIVGESQDRINALNTQAREDAMRYARIDLAEAVQRLKVAREAMTQFRTRTQIVDPAADIQSRMGVMANLQQVLAEALIQHDLLQETASQTDPRVTNARRLIDVIRKRIAAERQTFTSDSTETGAVGEDYPSLIAEYESLSVDRQFAEETYRAALVALDVARANAARQSRYLAAYINPTLPTTSEYPQRYVLTGLAALFLVMFWSILMLVFYSLRDRR